MELCNFLLADWFLEVAVDFYVAFNIENVVK